jgi:hypothetical protein
VSQALRRILLLAPPVVNSQLSRADTHSAGLTITIARICDFSDQELDMQRLEKSWELCQETLADMTMHGEGPRRCLDSIKMMGKRVFTEIGQKFILLFAGNFLIFSLV